MKPSLFHRYKLIRPLHGGNINQTYLALSPHGHSCVVKYNKSAPNDFFRKEAMGLTYLKSKSSILQVPEVYDVVSADDGEFLIMEYMTPASSNHQIELGEGIAELHANTNRSFGLQEDNYIATLNQGNELKEFWVDFYIDQRIAPLLQLLNKQKDLQKLEKVRSTLNALFQESVPALLHGDLWSGNVFYSKKGWTIIDPAIYFGDASIDLSMTYLFGGFNPEFYDYYKRNSPHEITDIKIQVGKWYPLLVHAVLFQGSYYKEFEMLLNTMIY